MLPCGGSRRPMPAPVSKPLGEAFHPTPLTSRSAPRLSECCDPRSIPGRRRSATFAGPMDAIARHQRVSPLQRVGEPRAFCGDIVWLRAGNQRVRDLIINDAAPIEPVSGRPSVALTRDRDVPPATEMDRGPYRGPRRGELYHFFFLAPTARSRATPCATSRAVAGRIVAPYPRPGGGQLHRRLRMGFAAS